MNYLNENYEEENLVRKLFPEKAQKFEEIPTLGDKHYELFLSQAYLVWFNNFINRALNYLNKKEWPVYGKWPLYEANLDIDNKSLALLEAVLLNYFNDLNMPIKALGDAEGISLNRVFYLKYQDNLFLLYSVIYLGDNVFYDLAKGNPNYYEDKQEYFVTLDMLQDYVRDKYNKEIAVRNRNKKF